MTARLPAVAGGRWVWFLVSLFIGPLATALIVIWPAVPPARP